MTERTIKSMAKELAGKFYEQNRSAGFRFTFPTVEHYLKGVWHNKDGSKTVTTPGWQHHVVLARKMLVAMLRQNDNAVTPYMKNSIYDALLEDGNKRMEKTAKQVTQARH